MRDIEIRNNKKMVHRKNRLVCVIADSDEGERKVVIDA